MSPVLSNVFVCLTCFDSGVCILRFHASYLASSDWPPHMLLENHKKTFKKTPKVKNINFLKNHEKSPKVKESQFSQKHENPQNPTPRTLTILIMRLKNLKIREHVLTTKRISAEFLFSRFTTEMKRSNRRIMLLGTVAVGAQRS